MKMKYLLSIDSGGVRGIIALYALMKLEEETGKLTRDIFSFVAGTSTGALITAAIAAGVPASQILEMYTVHAGEIFTQRPWNILKRIFLGYMYSTQRLHDIVKKELGAAGEWTLNDSPIDILIPAKRVVSGIPIYFVKDERGGLCRCGIVNLVDCATASAAAPTFFYPWKVDLGQKEDDEYLIDGAVGVAGNPVYLACVEAFYYTKKYHPTDTTIVSLGTGRFPSHNKPGWLWDWFSWIVSELLSSPGEQQTEIVQRHFPKTPFFRLDPDIEKLDPTITQNIRLDDISAIGVLKEIGIKFAKLVDWEAILDGSDTKFLVGSENTLPKQYKKP